MRERFQTFCLMWVSSLSMTKASLQTCRYQYLAFSIILLRKPKKTLEDLGLEVKVKGEATLLLSRRLLPQR